jgi:hypothetical protein
MSESGFNGKIGVPVRERKKPERFEAAKEIAVTVAIVFAFYLAFVVAGVLNAGGE